MLATKIVMLNKIKRLIKIVGNFSFIRKWLIQREVKRLRKEQEKLLNEINKQLLLEILHTYIIIAANTLKSIDNDTLKATYFKQFYELDVVNIENREISTLSDITKIALIRYFGDQQILQDYIKLKILEQLVKQS